MTTTSKYAMKKVARLTSKPTEGETLSGQARALDAVEVFTDFVLAGEGSTFFFESAIFRYVNDERRGEISVVVATTNPELEVGDFVHFSELSRLAERGEQYRPKLDRDPRIENKRAELFAVLLRAIREAGGHEAVMAAINAEQERKEAEEKAAAEAKAAEAAVVEIFNKINSGEFQTDPMKIFDQTKVQTFAIGGDQPVVFRTGFVEIGYGKRRHSVFAAVLRAAPFGVPGEVEVKVGTHLKIAFLFDLAPTHEVEAFAKVIRQMFSPAQLEEAKTLAESLKPPVPVAEDLSAIVPKVDNMPSVQQPPSGMVH
jgi:hypothetical protein